MKLYKIRGTSEWVPWNVLYNERGYNSVPCIDMAFKSISPWGTSAGTGYRTNGSGDATYFVSGKTGWNIAFSLPGTLGVYPDDATPIQMIKDGVISDAVWMEFWGAKWYLIQAEIVNERYWIIEQGLSEYGWEIYEGKDYEFILVDGTTGSVVHGVEQLNEMVFAPTGYFTIEDTGDVVFVEQSPYPIVSRFHVDFDTVQTLADGAYIDTVLPYYTSKLYIAGIVDRVAETVVDFGLTVSNEGGYVRVTNNTGASVTLTRLAIQSIDATGAEVVEVVDGQDNHAYAFKWNDGGTPYWWISYSGERHWTDALGNWSEVPSVVLPTVSTQDGSTGLWINSGSGFTTNVQYDQDKLYCIGTGDGQGNVTEYGWLITSDNGYVMAMNNTDSSIYVLGWTLRYMDSNNAEITTVYDSFNNPYNAFKFTANNTDYYYVLDGTQTDWTDDLSSIGYHIVLPHDDATGTISSITLPTAHSGSYTGVSFDSLRYYAKGTLLNTGSVYRQAFGATYTWYYGTLTWEDESLGDLSNNIVVSDPDETSYGKQTIFRVLFISSDKISGYHPWDTSDAGVTTSQVTSYIYNNGVHSITFWSVYKWFSGIYAGRIMIRYLDGTTTFNNLNAFDLVSVSGGSLSKDTTTDRYDMYNVWGGDVTVKAYYTT